MQYIDEANQAVIDHVTKFTLGKPFRPFEQLLAVLPRASNWMLPEMYRNLMEDPKSPIYKYYPEVFEVDMNLSVSPWEGIALLPFIDEEYLNEAVLSLQQSGAELTRNQEFVNNPKQAIMFKYDYEKSLTKNRIKGPVGFGPISDDVKCLEYEKLSLDHCGGKFVPTLSMGAKGVLPGSPHISAIPFSWIVKKVPVKTFGMSSKYQTMVLQVMDVDAAQQKQQSDAMNNSQQAYETIALSYLKKFLSHPLYCGW